MSDAIWNLGSIVDEAKETGGEVVLTPGLVQAMLDIIEAAQTARFGLFPDDPKRRALEDALTRFREVAP